MTINHLITVGIEGKAPAEKFSRKILYSLPRNPRVRSLTFDDLIYLMKGLAILEQDQDRYRFGSTTVMGNLLKLLKFKDTEHKDRKVNDLINWMLNNRSNSYIPFGMNVPLHVKSISDYAAYENKRFNHRLEMDKIKEERSVEPKKKKKANELQHKILSEAKKKDRAKLISRLNKLKTANRLKYILESNDPINMFPEEYSELTSYELEKLTPANLLKLSKKLDFAQRGSRWKMLKKVINEYLKSEAENKSYIPKYIYCPDCSNILETSFKEKTCPNPLCRFSFRGLSKYLDMNISELHKEVIKEYKNGNSHAYKLAITATKYYGGLYFTQYLKNFNKAGYREKNEGFILTTLIDLNTIKDVLQSDIIKTRDGVVISKNGFKMFWELYGVLRRNWMTCRGLSDFLLVEFPEFRQRYSEELTLAMKKRNKLRFARPLKNNLKSKEKKDKLPL